MSEKTILPDIYYELENLFRKHMDFSSCNDSFAAENQLYHNLEYFSWVVIRYNQYVFDYTLLGSLFGQEENISKVIHDFIDVLCDFSNKFRVCVFTGIQKMHNMDMMVDYIQVPPEISKLVHKVIYSRTSNLFGFRRKKGTEFLIVGESEFGRFVSVDCRVFDRYAK